ncbi:hypothetical protein, partial [Enterococcus faecium]|uniref:hypothetical protein n=1 Tax=Enterococcus faecium TaxID=1352 RepID=UPI001C613CBE
GEISTGFQLHRFDQRSNGFGLTAGRNDEILTRWNLEKILTNRVRGIDSNPLASIQQMEEQSEKLWELV